MNELRANPRAQIEFQVPGKPLGAFRGGSDGARGPPGKMALWLLSCVLRAF